MSTTRQNSTSLDDLASQLAARLVAADKDVEDKVLDMIKAEDRTDLQPFPKADKSAKKIKNEYLRARAQKILELRVKGFSFDEIADALDYKTGKHAKAAYDRFMDKFEREDIASIRQLQAERLEMAWRGLAPKIEQGRERAVEVGMKVLDRQARLLGIDVADQLVEKTTNQPIQINIMAHPGDARAKDLIIEHQPQELLPPATPSGNK